ncbi:DNA cytosine methyltransferase [Nocardia sp. NPDC057353]|uniref:DNA cytosine methyltransferase n=1 Tax=Nocardia sp. NPDC057353 TaxID=3346104 RepID=UPI003639EA7A
MSSSSDLSYDAVPPEQVRMIDLFAGPGGLDVAARWLGIPAVGIEWDRDACLTRVAAKLGTRHADVRDLALLHRFPEAEILTGGPPCQTFSVAGSGAGRRALDQVLHFVERMCAGIDIGAEVDALDDPRTGLILQPLRWALAAGAAGRPFRTIVLEQVPTVLPVWRAIGAALEQHGYLTDVDVLRTEQFGVPQTRRRAILVARLDGAALLPAATHRPYSKRTPRDQGSAAHLPWETMARALPERHAPFSVVSNYGTGGNPKLRGRRASSEPSATVTSKVGRNRVLRDGEDQPRFSPGEAGRLQTFPLDYPWRGADRYQQVGNAIPPRLGAHILAAAVFGGRPRGSELDRAVDRSWFDVAEGGHIVGLEEFAAPRAVPARVNQPGLWETGLVAAGAPRAVAGNSQE